MRLVPPVLPSRLNVAQTGSFLLALEVLHAVAGAASARAEYEVWALPSTAERNAVSASGPLPDRRAPGDTSDWRLAAARFMDPDAAYPIDTAFKVRALSSCLFPALPADFLAPELETEEEAEGKTLQQQRPELRPTAPRNWPLLPERRPGRAAGEALLPLLPEPSLLQLLAGQDKETSPLSNTRVENGPATLHAPTEVKMSKETPGSSRLDHCKEAERSKSIWARLLQGTNFCMLAFGAAVEAFRWSCQSSEEGGRPTTFVMLMAI
ncbi:unnamed protein product [Polarella glacialis]|uniref:Uncharacterized protein n=1 Tax=Polarella glacialis TaxID=89957 RepID=A0A813LNV6_POLGL|nr:unnamed protein product [Polarella glacialis]